MPTTLPLPRFMRPAPLAALSWLAIALAGLVLLPAEAALRSLWLAPWCEEAVLRWGVQAPLARRLGPLAALVLSALAFGAAHMLFAHDAADLWRAAATTVPAAWIGRGYERHGRLAPCVAWHAGFNLLWLGANAV